MIQRARIREVDIARISLGPNVNPGEKMIK